MTAPGSPFLISPIFECALEDDGFAMGFNSELANSKVRSDTRQLSSQRYQSLHSTLKSVDDTFVDL